jgi:hypothetical protein
MNAVIKNKTKQNKKTMIGKDVWKTGKGVICLLFPAWAFFSLLVFPHVSKKMSSHK